MIHTRNLMPLHVALRDATRDGHQAIDQHVLLAPLSRPGLQRADYGQALSALHGPHMAMEEAIMAWLGDYPGLFDFHTRRKRPALEQDLDDLALVPPPCAAPMPVPAGLGDLIGLVYVTEGATLGGRFLARLVRQQLGDSAPLRFLEGYGDLTEARWLDFWRFANHHACTSVQLAAANTAKAAFQGFLKHLEVLADQQAI